MIEMVGVHVIDDIFATGPLRVLRSSEPSGGWASDYAPAGFDCDRNLVVLNRRRITDDVVLEAGDVIAFTRMPAGIAAGFLASAEGVAAFGIADVLVVSTVLTITLLLVSFGVQQGQLSPGIRPQKNAADERESPSRGFNGITNTRGAGNPLAFVYGEHRMGGQIAAQYQRPAFDVQVGNAAQTAIVRNEQAAGAKSTIYTRVALCSGPLQSISSVQFDDVDISVLRGVLYSTSLGIDDHRSGSRAPPGFNKIGTVQTVDQDVTVAGGAVSVTTSGSVDALEMILRFPDGLYANFLGIIIGLTIEVKIEFRVSDASEPWATLTGANVSVVDKSVAAVEFRVGFPPLEDSAEYDVRVTRITVDSFAYPRGEEHAFKIKELIGYSIDERSHPGVAEVDIEHSITDQDSQLIPSRITSLVKGARNIRVYSDATTYAEAYTQNPAWILADFLTDEEKGNGDIYSYDDIDIASFLLWADYCDAVVDDGRGSTEVRCRYDYVHDTVEDSQSIRNRIAFCGDAWVIQAGGKWRVVIDRIEPMADVFNDANIAPDSLEYAYVPEGERATKIAGHFTNSELNYNRDVAYDEDDTVVVAGELHREVAQDCFGMTRISQVKRTLRRLLLWNRYSDRQLSFRTGLEACTLTAGSVFGFASAYAGIGLDGGRIIALRNGGQTLALDGWVDLVAGTVYEIIVRFGESNTRGTQTFTAERTERTDTVTVPGSWLEQLEIGDQYSIGPLDAALELYRVVSISNTEDFERTVIARKYDDRTYSLAGLVTPASITLPLAPRPVAFPDPVLGLVLLEAEPENSAGNTHKTIVVGWEAPEEGDVARWDVYYHRAETPADETAWNLAGSTTARHFVIDPVTADADYRVAVVAVGPSGNALAIEDSTQATITITAA